MPTYNFLQDDKFGLMHLTHLANVYPSQPTWIRKNGLFQHVSVSSLTVALESYAGSIQLLETQPYAGPGQTLTHSARGGVAFNLATFKTTESVLAHEVQDVRGFGSMTEVDTIEALTQRKLKKHYDSFDLTEERMLFSALTGVVASRNDSTLLNLFTMFDIRDSAGAAITSIPTSYFDLANNAFKPRVAFEDFKETIIDNLDFMPSSITVLCGKTFYKTLLDNKEIKETYLNTGMASDLRNKMGEEYSVYDIKFVKYMTPINARVANGNAPFIADDEAYVLVHGISDLYQVFWGPAPYASTVNTPGVPRYVRADPLDKDMGVEFALSMHPMPIVSKPKALRKLKLGAAP